jgi:hypothetical protein|tara:strand:- start:17 stop:229 length:213 start_codon:yes stop_codon:yes gene_type:complete
MSNIDKLGPYIQKLMTTVIDNKEDDFVKDLALTELNRLKVNIDEFLVKHFQKESEVSEEKIEKQLLQEDK